MEVTGPVWARDWISFPISTSQILIVSSAPAEHRYRPVGRNVRNRTGPECPANVRIGRPVVESQNLIVPSRPDEARDEPSGANATAYTGPSCPFRTSACDASSNLPAGVV